MSKKSEHTARNVAIGATVAAVAGYVAGILTAPKSGKETRKDISNAAGKAKRQAELQLKKLHSELNDLLKASRAQVEKLSAQAKEQMNKAIGQAETAREKAREILSAIHEGDATDEDLKTAIAEVKKATESLKKYLGKKTTD